MKATGIVRRIDDLGRIVIPKEIRRTLRIREGDPLEIFTDNDGGVILRKYSPIGEMLTFAAHYAEALNRATGMGVLICDRDHVVAAAGVSRKEYTERRVTQELEEIMESRTARTPNDGRAFRPVEGIDRMTEIAVPIIAAGDVSGAVVMLAGEAAGGDAEVKLALTAAGFLGRVMENG
jgi:AbrB family transcriptional regulator (stage V sporulation protein T)